MVPIQAAVHPHELLRVLHIIADPMPPDEAVDRRVAEAFFSTLRETAPNIEVDTYDLYAYPPPYFDYRLYRFLWYPLLNSDYKPTPQEEIASRYLCEQTARFNQADILVLTAPVWNYSIPAIMKAWIDIMIAPNYVFRVVDNHREPIHQIDRLFIFLSSGGAMFRCNARENLINQLKATFEYIGISEPTIVLVDGQDPATHPGFRQRELFGVKQAQNLAREVAAGAR